MKDNQYFSLGFDNDKFVFINQTKLPFQEEYVETDSYERIAEAIEKLEIRGAPAIGVAAGYALALSFKNSVSHTEEQFKKSYKRLFRTRPTAYNLFFVLDELKKVFDKNKDSNDIYQILLNKAKEFHKDDIEKCDRIGRNGLAVFKTKSTVLTHCNTGKLATAGSGTAFSVIKTGFENNLVEFVYADETRPLLQGSRLTAFELEKNGIPFAIESDSSSAYLMKTKKIDFVIVGADRIALNGDTANKIGTYNLAILCNYHDIPFYIAAPTTTIDKNIPTGEQIEIEVRNKIELLTLNGYPVSSEKYETFSPAFDVTPAHLITGIITEKKIYFFPYNFIYE
jgi:methylthioribose-1-phosphate isomerase